MSNIEAAMKRGNRKKVLIMIGWHDPIVLTTVCRCAHEFNWQLDPTYIYQASFPIGWRGNGILTSAPFTSAHKEFIRQHAQEHPTVLFGWNEIGIPMPGVRHDDRATGKMAAHHFLERGFRDLAWLSNTSATHAKERKAGFLETLKEYGLRATCIELRESNTSKSISWQRRRNWIAKNLADLPKPLGLFVVDDPFAAETIDLCLENKWRVPEDIAVLGVGNSIPACDYAAVPISSIKYNHEKEIETAASLLNSLMQGHKIRETNLVIQAPGIVTRRSTSYLAVSNPALRQALEFTNQHYHEQITLNAQAKAAGISVSMLYHLFHKELRRTPAAHLLQLRMEHAKQKLLTSNAKITDVARECGFPSLRTMQRCFIRTERFNPTAWQQHHKMDSHHMFPTIVANEPSCTGN